MSELREAAQADSKLRNQHKAFTHWFLGLHETTALAPEDLAWSAWKAALAQPETTAEPVAWLNRYHAAMVTQDHATAVAMGFTTPLYAHPPRDEWRPASEPPDSDRLVIVWVADDRSPSNGGYFCTDCLRPSRANPDARIWASIGVTHWRDVQPPTEESK